MKKNRDVFENYIREMDCDDIAKLLHAKYRVPNSGAKEAVRILKCFLLEKALFPSKLLILPQLSDWAWHELICQTQRYGSICDALYGEYLHHAAVILDCPEGDHLEKAYMNTILLLKRKLNINSYGYKNTSGWENRRYRLREEYNPFLDIESKVYFSDESVFDSGKLPDKNDLSWLVNRASARFSISLRDAASLVSTYKGFLSNCRNEIGVIAPSLEIDYVWCEHILWTEVYQRDCQSIFGRFLHREAFEVTGSVREAA